MKHKKMHSNDFFTVMESFLDDLLLSMNFAVLKNTMTGENLDWSSHQTVLILHLLLNKTAVSHNLCIIVLPGIQHFRVYSESNKLTFDCLFSITINSAQSIKLLI